MKDEIPLHKHLNFSYEPPESGVGYAEVTMPVEPDSMGVNENLHGGAIATMVDLACALAATGATNFDFESESLVTVDMHVRYVGRPRTGTVVAKAQVVRLGSKMIVIECKVEDTDGHLVSSADLGMMRVPLRRPLEIDND